MRRSAREKTENFDQKIWHIFLSGPVVVFKWLNGPGWPVEYVSPNVEEVFGFSPEDFLSGTVLYADILHPEDRRRVEREVATATKKGAYRFIHKPYRIVRKDGSMVWLEDRTTIMRDEGGNTSHYLGYVLDISRREKLTERLLRSEQELKKHHNGLEELVRDRTRELDQKTNALEEANIALRVLLRKVEEEKKALEQVFIANLKSRIFPYIEKIKKSRPGPEIYYFLEMIENNTNDIMSPLIKNVGQFNLTPREVEVVSLIKDGKSTKEIADMLGVASSAVNSYRNNVRAKLKIKHKKVNLRIYLQSIK